MTDTETGGHGALSQVVLSLPWPPTANTYYRRVGSRTVLSRQGRDYRAAVARVVRRAGWPSLGASRLSVTLLVSPPDRRRRDLDNLLKSILDSLELAGVYDDDGQVDRLVLERLDCDPAGEGVVEAVIDSREKLSGKLSGGCAGGIGQNGSGEGEQR